MPHTDPIARKEYHRKKFKDNQAKRQAYNRANYDADKCRVYQARSAAKHPATRMWSVAKQRAKKRGIEFSISPSDVIIPERCPVFGFPLVMVRGGKLRGGTPTSPSLDRIDGAKGYVPGNVRVISHLANSMKHSATAEQLRQFAAWVLSQ